MQIQNTLGHFLKKIQNQPVFFLQPVPIVSRFKYPTCFLSLIKAVQLVAPARRHNEPARPSTREHGSRDVRPIVSHRCVNKCCLFSTDGIIAVIGCGREICVGVDKVPELIN